MDRGGGTGRPQAFGAGVSLGVFAGLVLGSLMTLWWGEAAVNALQRLLHRLTTRRERIHFELLLQ
jgi:hypothetical protein